MLPGIFLKGNITISSPYMIFMKLPMLQDKCIFGLNRNKRGESPASFPWYQNFLDVYRAFQETALIADMCFNTYVITAKTTSTHDECYFLTFWYYLLLN